MAYSSIDYKFAVSGNFASAVGSEWTCTFAGQSSNTDLEGLASDAADAWMGAFSPLMVGDANYLHAAATHLADSAIGEVTLSGVHGGIDGVGTVPAETCVVFSWRTGTPGRSGRGRMYLPYVPGTDVSTTEPARWLADAISSYQTSAGDFNTFLIEGGSAINQCVNSHLHLALYPVTGAVVNPVIGSQRRRRT